MKELQRFEIGELDESVPCPSFYANKLEPTKQKEFEKAYRELRAKLVTMGLFNPSYPYYTFKVLSNFLLLGASIYLAINFSSIFVHFVAAILLGLFWQQSGWLAHDFLHHQVFKNRMFGDLIGLIIGDLCQGFSVHWWKTKHNSHHAVPNLLASVPGACDGDPDIDTMPFLAWTLKMAETGRDSPLARFMVSWQTIIYFPILLFARLSWAHQSWVFVFGGWGQHSVQLADMDRKTIQYPLLEKLFLILHYCGLLWIMSHMTISHAVFYFFTAQMSCGFFLALVFGLGHNGMAVYPADQRPDFWKLQVTTSRNIKSTMFVDWFCGGLQYQVDHHLFPSLPRHSFGEAHKLVAKFCKEQNVSYHEADLLEGTIEILKHLDKISKQFIKEFPGM